MRLLGKTGVDPEWRFWDGTGPGQMVNTLDSRLCGSTRGRFVRSTKFLLRRH